MRALVSLAVLVAATDARAQAPAPATAPAPQDRARAERPTETPRRDPVAEALRATQGGLTADEVARRAVDAAPSMEAQRARLDAAAARVDQTLISFLPVVSGTAGYTRLSPVDVQFGSGAIVGAAAEGGIFAAPCTGDLAGTVPPGVQCIYDMEGGFVGAQQTSFPNPLNRFSLQASVAVPLTDYLLGYGPQRKSAKQHARATELDAQAERRRVELDARNTYYTWLRATAQVVVVDQSLAHTRARLSDANALFEAGVVSKADVMRLESMVESAEMAAEQSVEFRDLAARQIALHMGEERVSGSAFSVGDDVLAPPAAAVAGRADADELVRDAWSKRVELQALGSTADGLESGIRAARRGYYPALDAFAETTYANPNQRFFPPTEQWNATWSAGLSLTWTLNQTLFTRPKVQEAKANARAVDAQRAQLRRGIAMEVHAAHSEVRRAAIARSHTARARAAAEEAYRVAADLYASGEATTTDVIEAETQRVNAQLTHANAAIDGAAAAAKLDYAVGD